MNQSDKKTRVHKSGPGAHLLWPVRSGEDGLCFEFVIDSIKGARSGIAGGKNSINELYYKDVRGASREDIVKSIREFSFRLSRRRNSPVSLIIPANLIITKNIEIPSHDPKEIKEIINLQAGRLTPYSREEVIIDYVRIGVFRQSYTKLLVVIVHKDVINKQLALFAEAGLRVVHIALSTQACGELLYRHFKHEVADSPLCMIHLDSLSTDFGVFLQGRQIFLRSIAVGAHHLLTEKEKHVGRFIDEVKKSLDAYQAEDIEVNPKMAIFTGAIDGLSELEVLMLDAFRLPVKLLSVADVVSRGPHLKKEFLSPKEISFLVVSSLLLAGERSAINLIPDEMKMRMELEKRGREIIKSGVLVMTILVFICGVFLVHIYLKTEFLRKLNSKFKTLNQEAGALEKDFSKVRIVRSFLEKRGQALGIFSEVYDLTPLEIAVINIRLRDNGSLSIRGEAASMSAVFSYARDLEQSILFKAVKTRYTSKKKIDDQELVDFEIAAMLEGASEEGS